jgi:hypothetical protein
MGKGKQPPADDISLRDVIDHMNHKFTLIENKVNDGFQKLDRRMEQGFAEAQRERREILRRVEAEANAADDTLQKLDALAERVEIFEKHLALSND